MPATIIPRIRKPHQALSHIPVLTGPTAVGKTSLSLEIAQLVDAEIISADSRQIYRGLDIGTAKPDPETLAAVPHHFIDERAHDEPFSAGAFARQATERIRAVMERGRVPLVVGGSTLYLHALQVGLADVPNVPDELRDEIEERLDEEGAEALFAELVRVDPATARTLEPTKTQRLLRGLEVYYGTGKPLSSYHDDQEPPAFAFRTIVLHRPREVLYERINRRVDQMLDAGLLGEVRTLLDQGIDPASNPLRTIGYREPIAYLQDEFDYDEMMRLIKRNTRRYAKRQLTWFQRYPTYHWLPSSVGVGCLVGFFGLQ